MKALHFGAGNIGRGFVGVILHNAGYDLVFADVAAPLIEALSAQDSYTVHEVGQDPKDITVTNFIGVNSTTDKESLLGHIADADIITTGSAIPSQGEPHRPQGCGHGLRKRHQRHRWVSGGHSASIP